MSHLPARDTCSRVYPTRVLGVVGPGGAQGGGGGVGLLGVWGGGAPPRNQFGGGQAPLLQVFFTDKWLIKI